MSVIETVNARESSRSGSDSYRSSQLESMRRKMTSASLGDDDTSGGLGDPFAEIFARIATAEAPSPPPEVIAPESSTDEDSTDEDSELSNESTPVEESNSQENAEPSGEIAPVTTEETLLSTDTDQVTEFDEEVVVHEVTADDQLNGDADQPTEEVDIELTEVESTETIQQTPETAIQDEVVATDSSVDQDVVVSALQSKRRDHGGTETEEAATTTTLAESEETEVRAASTTANADPDTGEEQRNASERPAAATANSDDDVQRRRYSNGQDKPGPQDRSVPSRNASSDATGEAPPINGRGIESRPAQPASSNGGIDVSSMTPVSSSASAAVLSSASVGVSGSNSAAKATTKQAGISASSGNASVTASATGGDTTAPTESPANNQRTSPTGPAKSNATGTDTLSAVQRAKLVQRVSRGFQQLGSNGGQIRMRLAPDQLGSVQLQMKLQNGELSGTMVTQTDAASQALREQLPQLRSSLESQGIRLDRMDIQTETAANSQDASTPDGRFGDPSGQSGRGFDQRGQLADQRERSSWSDVRATPKGKPEAAQENSPRVVSSVPAGAVDLKA